MPTVHLKSFSCNKKSQEQHLSYVGSIGGQKAEFGVRGGGLRTFFADAESENRVCWRRRSGGGDRFFLIFFAKFKLIIVFKFS